MEKIGNGFVFCNIIACVIGICWVLNINSLNLHNIYGINDLNTFIAFTNEHVI